MSYRSFKHLLGETSLERKCRFIFGLGIFMLVTVSFLLYGLKTESLVKKQTTQTARMLINPTLMNIHYKKLGNENFESIIDVLWGGLRPLDDLPNYEAWVLNPYGTKDPKKQPDDEFERATLARFLQAATSEEALQKTGKPREKPYYFGDGTPMWADRINKAKKEYQYVQAVTFKSSCLMDCHSKDSGGLGGQDENSDHIDNHLMRPAADGQHWVVTKAGDLAGAVVVHIPMEQTEKAINSNRAMLITAALVTAILAMVSSYMIVRYVIVKPVKHLRDVSDAIAAGASEHPQPDPDRRRVRGPVARVQPDAPQPGGHAAGTARGEQRPGPQGRRAGPGQHGPLRDEPAQERLPGHHEPRAAHAAELDHRLLRGALRQRCPGRTAAALCQQHPDLRQDAPGDDQRHPRPGQDRERQDGGPDRGLLDPRRLRGARRT